MSSLDNTVISLPGQSIVDAQGASWSIINGQVAVNGVVDQSTGRVIEMAYEGGKVWQKNSDNLWWSKTNATAAWSPPYGTTVDPIPGVVVSVNDTVVVTAAHSITDASGNVWTIANGQVALNGVADPSTAHVAELAYQSGKIWQENTSGLWWSKTKPSDAWGPTYGTSVSPVVVSSTKTWVANNPLATSTGFTDRENWTGGVAPGAGDTAVISNGNATFASPASFGALGATGMTLQLGSTDPSHTAGLTMTTNVTLAAAMTLQTGTSSGAVADAANILAVSSTLTNQGHITVASGTASSNLAIRLRYGTFTNTGTVQTTGAKSLLTVSGTTQYGNSGSIVNNGSMVVSGGTIDLENPVTGAGSIQVGGNGTAKIGNAFAAGQTVSITAGTLEFGVVNPSTSPAWATNPGMQFLSQISFAGASNPTYASSTEQLKFDGAWFNGAGDSVVLSNLQPGKAEMTVFEGNVKIFDGTIAGHYDQPEFTLSHVGADAYVTFKPQTLVASIPHS